MKYYSSENKKYYFPPLLSNGNMAFAVDEQGTIGYSMADYVKKGIVAFDGIVIRAGRRSALCNSLQARLFPLGKFIFDEGSQTEDWWQNLEVEKGYFESNCVYKSGSEIYSKGFIHPDMNVYALQKTFKKIGKNKKFVYHIELSGYNESISKYMNFLYTKTENNIGCIGFKMYGMDVFSGEIRFFTDKKCTITPTENGADIVFAALENETVTFYYYLEDDIGDVDFIQVLQNYKDKINELRFEGLLSECTEYFKTFYEYGYVQTSSKQLNEIYKASLYSVKCNTTDSSIAVGLNNGTWDGRYFAFDEYTSFLGLLSSNRLDFAKRVPAFRLNVCLKNAIKRASDCHRNADTEDMARFHWETCGDDKLELSPDGNWLDHIFHIPLVGIGAFNYYEYSEDEEFLRECYSMIRACSKFITKHMLYKDGDKYYIGKCTDLERLGSSVQNPFMTACGAIKLLECLCNAGKILNIDDVYLNECECIACELTKNLPVQNDMYVPFINCKQKSIAVFAGKFPFDVLDADDRKMLKAWEDYEINGNAYGNMYPLGKSISPWYACWKAEGYARAKLTEKAYESLKQSYKSAGVFAELFEINEETVCIRPWFATAAGIFVSTVNDMLIQRDGKTIHLLPAFPHELDVAFKLAAKGGVTVEAVVEQGNLKKVLVLKNGVDVTNQFEIKF